MENLVQIQNIISALIGFGSAIIVAIIAGIFQLRIAKRNREIQEKQIEQSREEFIARMEQSQKEYAEKIEKLREDQKKSNLEKVNDKLQAETNRFYEELMKEIVFYDRLLNELHYLNNIANPKDKEFRIKGAYPHIDNNIKDLVGDVSLHQDIAKLLGALRAKISLYNVALEQGADTNVLEEALKRVYDLIDPINTERFENYANAQTNLRNFEIKTAKQIIQE
jgi:hypothetical protein